MKYEGYLQTRTAERGQKIYFGDDTLKEIKKDAYIIVEKKTKQGGLKNCLINCNDLSTIDYWETKG